MKTTSLRRRDAREGRLLALPLLLGCLVFYAVPLVMVLRNSMTTGIARSQRFSGLANYITLLGNSVFRLALGNTLKFLAVALPLILVLSYAIALLLKSHAQRYEALKSVLLLPYVMPIAGSVLLIDLLFAQSGLLNQGLYILGLPVADWLHSRHAFAVAVGLYLWKNTGYSVILLLSGLNTISDEHYDAAALDGANGWQRLRYITAPQMWYSVFFATVFSLINAFKYFREIFLIGGVHPHDSIYMLQHFINNAFEMLNYPKLAAASILLMLLLLGFFALGYRWVAKKEAYKE